MNIIQTSVIKISFILAIFGIFSFAQADTFHCPATLSCSGDTAQTCQAAIGNFHLVLVTERNTPIDPNKLPKLTEVYIDSGTTYCLYSPNVPGSSNIGYQANKFFYPDNQGSLTNWKIFNNDPTQLSADCCLSEGCPGGLGATEYCPLKTQLPTKK